MHVRASYVWMRLQGGRSFNLHFTDTKAQETYSEGLFESDLQRHSLQDVFQVFVHVTIKKEKAYEVGLASPKTTILLDADRVFMSPVQVVNQ